MGSGLRVIVVKQRFHTHIYGVQDCSSLLLLAGPVHRTTEKTGNRMAASIAMIAITTRSSINVKARRLR